MLVVTANWAVADGSLVARPRHEQAEWLAAVRRAVIRSGVQPDGCYAPVDRLDVVLAGDTFDALTSAAWLGGVRPWHAGRKSADIAARVLVAAATRGRRLLGGLARWARAGILVPSADGRGRPDWTRPRRVPVHVAALPGDRDRWIAAALPRLTRRGIRLAGAWSAGGISVCHGAEFAPAWSGCGASEPGRPTLGESLAVDLVARFAGTLRGEALWPESRGLVVRLASSPPGELPTKVAEWLVAARGPAARVVRDRWLAAVAGWRRAALLAEPVCAAVCDPIDAVAAWLAGLEAPGAAAGETEALFAMTVPPPSRGVVVLGHPPMPRSGASVVCLGGPRRVAEEESRHAGAVACITPVRPGGGPTHVVFPRAETSTAWTWLGAATAGEGDAAPRPVAAACRIVEAA